MRTLHQCSIRIGVAALFVLASALPLSAQTLVSTSPQNKKAVLEIYDGIYCTYCPQGHAIAQQILNDHPNDVTLISIHSGQYANPEPGDPDFRTDFGMALSGQTGLTGYPAGTVNRHIFPGLCQGSSPCTAISRSNWNAAVLQTLGEPSVVNIGAAATINTSTGVLTVNVEFYYTGTSYASPNFLHVALLQNHIAGPQIGGAAGDAYDHNHVLRHLLTGQWGQAIGTTNAGYFEGRQYTYTLPADIRNIPLDVADLQLAVFISEGHQEILNGVTVQPTYLVPHSNNANLLTVKSEPIICGEEISPTVRIRNEGSSALYSLQMDYQVNDGSLHTHTWYGALGTYEWADITLPTVVFEPAWGGNNISVWALNPNGVPDEFLTDNSRVGTFESAPICNTMTLKVELKTDAFGHETYWELLDDQGVVYDWGGNENVATNGGGQQTATPADAGAYSNFQFIAKYITVPAEGCYYLRVLDDYGDGLCCSYGNGFYRVKNAQGNLLLSGGLFHVEQREPIHVTQMVVASEEAIQEHGIALNVFPNPTNNGTLYSEFVLNEAQQVQLEIYDFAGRMVQLCGQYDLSAGKHELSLDVAKLPSGTYQLHLKTNAAYSGKVFVIQR